MAESVARKYISRSKTTNNNIAWVIPIALEGHGLLDMCHGPPLLAQEARTQMKEIQLTQGYVALVDDEDFKRCMEGPKWYALVVHRKDGSIATVYAVRNMRRADGKKRPQYLHRFILGVTDPDVDVDHKDHNGLNNSRSNLRLATVLQNMHNKRMHIGSVSGCKGVCWDTLGRKWKAQICINGKQTYLGMSISKGEAKEMYDAAALKHFGEFAFTNAMMTQEVA